VNLSKHIFNNFYALRTGCYRNRWNNAK